MNETAARRRWGRIRPLGFVLATLLIVLVPSMLLQRMSTHNLEAADWVAHSYEVQAAIGELAATVRETEVASMVIALGLDTPAIRESVQRGRRESGERLEALMSLTRDNPEQQRLTGRLQELIIQRTSIMDQLLAGDTRSLEDLATRYPIRGLLDALREGERELLTDRSLDAEHQRAAAVWLRWGALSMQLVLLGLLTLLLWRQMTHRLRAEAHSRRANARALAMLQTVREPIVLLDGNLRIQMHNAAFAELYGVDNSDAGQSLSLDDIGDGAWTDPILRQRLADVLARDRELWDFEQEQRTADGVVRSVMLNARRMPLPDRDDDAILLTVSDVSLQKTTQRKIVELNRQLEGKVDQVSEVNRELEAFSYSVSHDLRAPLRHVAGFSDKLARHLGQGADDTAHHYLQTITSAAQRMSDLIDDLLVYSRLGRSALRLQAVDMQSLVDETRAMLDANAQAEGYVGHREWRIGALPILVADENMMRQVWINLLGNAVKYSARRAHAVIEVEHEAMSDGSHHFSVRDNGAGFDMAYAGKLFGVFQRLHKASEYPGTGIGLASVRRVLVRHGGRVWAEAQPDQGATLHFILPAALDAPPHFTEQSP